MLQVMHAGLGANYMHATAPGKYIELLHWNKRYHTLHFDIHQFIYKPEGIVLVLGPSDSTLDLG